jgi:hypothetical protein
MGTSRPSHPINKMRDRFIGLLLFLPTTLPEAHNNKDHFL